MLEEIAITSKAAAEALKVLKEEYRNRVMHCDGEIEDLITVIIALNNADRIVIE